MQFTNFRDGLALQSSNNWGRLVTGAADDDPSGIATIPAGAQFGYHMLWSMLFTYPLMSAVQLVSGRIGRVTGKGLAANLRDILPRWALLGIYPSRAALF
ncbi:divalent metal cation transporter [Ochrobactrum pseudogrignonense]|nr:divalent metal cation transporter [Brucella pseudogrignonensis]